MKITATIGLAEASEGRWDVAVVGAGPAGALAARQLAKLGHRVVLVDKAAFPRWKVCGCCISGAALATLASVGLGDLAASCGSVSLKSLRVTCGNASALIALPDGVALSRERFDAALVEEAIAAGAHFLPETRVRLLSIEDDHRTLGLQQRDRDCRVQCGIVVAADGLGGVLRNAIVSPQRQQGKKLHPLLALRAHENRLRIGAGVIVDEAPNFFQPGIVYMACGTDGYVGLVRLEDGHLDIAAAFDPSRVRDAGGPGEIAVRILSETDWPEIIGLREMRWRGTPSLTCAPKSLAEHRLFAIGDAAGYVEPFTGEGMSWALTSAVALVPLVDRALQCWDPRWMREWAKLHRKLIGPRQRVCRIVARVLRSRPLTRLLIGGLSTAPILARPLLRRLNRAPVFS